MTQKEAKTNNTIATQKAMIASHLVSGRSINPIEALNLYGCFRLGARIWDLRNEGMSISKEMVQAGRKKKFAKYKLISQ